MHGVYGPYPPASPALPDLKMEWRDRRLLGVSNACRQGKRAVIFVRTLLGPFQDAIHHGA